VVVYIYGVQEEDRGRDGRHGMANWLRLRELFSTVLVLHVELELASELTG